MLKKLLIITVAVSVVAAFSSVVIAQDTPPTKTGTFTLSMRLYWGSESIVDRTWKIPAVTIVK